MIQLLKQSNAEFTGVVKIWEAKGSKKISENLSASPPCDGKRLEVGQSNLYRDRWEQVHHQSSMIPGLKGCNEVIEALGGQFAI